jgi:hypothetical protein
MNATLSNHAPVLVRKAPIAAFQDQVPWMRLLTTTALFSIVTGALLVALDSRRPPAPTAPAVQTAAQYESPLGLKVTTRKQQVEIRWNHDCQAVRGADKGFMKITEGEMTELIPLDRRDLQDGFVAYTAMTNDVRIRFEVNQRDGSSLTESARVVTIP